MATGLENELITVRQAASECGRNPETVRRWIWSGKLQAEKLGNQLFVRRTDLEKFCAETPATSQTVASSAQTEEGAVAQAETTDSQERDEGSSSSNQSGIPAGGEDTVRSNPGARSGVIEALRGLRADIRSHAGNLNLDSDEQPGRDRSK